MRANGNTVVLTGVGLDGGPDIIRALRADPALNVRVVGVDSNPHQAGRHLCDSFHEVPPRDDAGYLDAVTAIAEEESARVIYPLPTFDQEIFAAARDDLESAGIAVPVSPLEAVRLCNDKWALYEHLRSSMPSLVPETARVASADELAEAVHGLGYPDRPVCIRRPVSRGAIGLRILESGPAKLEALLHENPGSLSSSLAEVLDSLRYADGFPEYLVQEYLPPDEWDADVLCDQGEAVVVATRRSLRMTASAAVVAALEPAPEVAAASVELVRMLRLGAVVNLAFRYTPDGELKLLEINPRIPFSFLCALGGGVNLVALAVRQALGEKIEPVEPKPGGYFYRHFQSVVTDGSGKPVIR